MAAQHSLCWLSSCQRNFIEHRPNKMRRDQSKPPAWCSIRIWPYNNNSSPQNQYGAPFSRRKQNWRWRRRWWRICRFLSRSSVTCKTSLNWKKVHFIIHICMYRVPFMCIYFPRFDKTNLCKPSSFLTWLALTRGT